MHIDSFSACVEFHIAFEGSEILDPTKKTMAQCEDHCEETIGCMYWTHETTTLSYKGLCTLFSSVSKKVHAEKKSSGSRNCVSPPPYECNIVILFAAYLLTYLYIAGDKPDNGK